MPPKMQSVDLFVDPMVTKFQCDGGAKVHITGTICDAIKFNIDISILYLFYCFSTTVSVE